MLFHFNYLNIEVVYYKSICIYFTDTITCIDISSDHELIVTGSKDKCIGVWSIS